MKMSKLYIVWIGILTLLWGGISAGHPLEHPKIVTAVVGPNGLEIDVVFYVNRGRESEEMRTDFDQNGNNRLEAKEQAALLKRLKGFATFALSIQVDGDEIEPREIRAILLGGQIGSSRPLGIQLQRLYPISWGEDFRTLRVEDSLRDRQKTIQVRLSVHDLHAEPTGVFHVTSKRPLVVRVQSPSTAHQ